MGQKVGWCLSHFCPKVFQQRGEKEGTGGRKENYKYTESVSVYLCDTQIDIVYIRMPIFMILS